MFKVAVERELSVRKSEGALQRRVNFCWETNIIKCDSELIKKKNNNKNVIQLLL